jgi:hypothetical protein
MADRLVPDAHFPKWVSDKIHGALIVYNADEEQAVASGRAIYEVTRSAVGDTIRVVGVKPASKA